MKRFCRKKLKFILTFLITCASISVVCAQEEDELRKRFQAGLVTGINLSSFNSRIGEFGSRQRNDYENFIRISPVIGFTSRYHFTKIFSLKGQLLFNSGGGSYRTDQTGVVNLSGSGNKAYFYKNYRLNYLEIPVLAEFDFMPNQSIHELHVKFAGGFSYGLLLASSLRYNGFAPTGSTTGILTNVKEDYQVTDFNYGKSSILNYVFDLTFDFENGKGLPLFVTLRYQLSADNVYNVDVLNGDNMATKMSTYSLQFGLNFN